MLPENKLLDQVKGFLDAAEGAALYQLALEASCRGPCLEIGSYCGKSALYLGAGCKANQGILFTVDHHQGSEEQQPGQAYFDPELFDPAAGQVNTLPFLRRTLALAGLTETVVPLVCRSAVVARLWATPLSLVFIDGGHAYDTVLTDYTAWAGHVMAGGYLAFHDIFPDPAQGGQAPFQVYQLALSTGFYREHPMVKSLGILQRLPFSG
jgi:predicted O-methyltransferase YrrM